MKKIALSLVALSALSLAACGGNTTTTAANNAAAAMQDTINQANSDIANASAMATNALDTQMNAVANATDAAQGAIANATAAAGNATR